MTTNRIFDKALEDATEADVSGSILDKALESPNKDPETLLNQIHNSPGNRPQKSNIQQLPKVQLELPFKPFTLDEVARATGAPTALIDAWSKMIGMRYGCGVAGHEYCQMFAIFVGLKYLEEGAPPERATAVVRFLCDVKPETLEAQLAKGKVWPVPRSLTGVGQLGQGCFVPLPDHPTAKRLRLDRLYAEFRHNIDQMFPNG